MDCVFVVLCCAICGCAGVFFGIADCKRVYGIPPKTQPHDGEWLFYDDGVDDGNDCTY